MFATVRDVLLVGIWTPTRVMRILFITYHFPPFMTSGAVRTGQTARYLSTLGHDVRVVSADNHPLRGGLPLEIPRDHVVYTAWVGSRLASSGEGWAHMAADAPARLAESEAARGGLPLATWRVLRWVSRHGFYVPDKQIGWYPYALRAALRVMRDWPVDLIYASAWPVTSLLVAATASRIGRAPWVAELRDLWSDNHYVSLHGWQHWIDRRLENTVLGSAAGLVSMSRQAAEILEKRYAQPICVIHSGFDPQARSASSTSHDSLQLTIVHLGWLYGGKRNPTPLFEALRLMGDNSRRIRVEFYGEEGALVERLARSCGVENSVAARGPVSHAESLARQAAADILLLLTYDAPGEECVVPGKLFEYLGAGRPILSIGAADGAVPDLIKGRRLGVVSSSPDEIAACLSRWLDEKRRTRRVETYPSSRVADFTRSAQMEKLSDFLRGIVPQFAFDSMGQPRS